MKSEPLIQKYMTTQPYAIEQAEKAESARRMMNELSIRHLPVIRQGKIAGIVSDRDLKLAAAFLGEDFKDAPVLDVCNEAPYIVSPHAKMTEVLKEMADKHYGSAIVADRDTLVGIFTTVDVCRALFEILQTRYHT